MRASLRRIAVAFCLPIGCTPLPAVTEPTVDGGGVDAALPDASVADGGAADATPTDGGDDGGLKADGGLERDAGPNVDGLRAGCSGSRGALSLPQVALTATSIYWVGPACGAGDRTPVLHKTPRVRIASGAPLCGQGVEFALPAADPAFVLPTNEGVAVVTHGRFVVRLDETSGATSVKAFGVGLSPSNIAAAAVAATAGKPMTVAWIATSGSPFYESGGSTVVAGNGGQNRGVAVTDLPQAFFAQVRNNTLYIDEKPGLGSPAKSADVTPVDQIHVAGGALLVRQGAVLSSNIAGTDLVPLPNIVSDGFAPTFGAPGGDVVNSIRGSSEFTLSRVARSGGAWVSDKLGTATPFQGIASAAGGTMIDVATTGACETTSDSFINFERFAKPTP